MKTSAILLLLISVIAVGCASTEDVTKDQSVTEKKADVYYTQGTSDLLNKNYQLALTNLLKAKELKPKDSKIRTNLGMAYYFREQIAFAISELKEAISLDEKNTDAKMNLATIYMEQNKISDAQKIYQEVLKDLTYTALFRVHYNLAVMNLKIGDRKGAYEELFLSLKEKDDYCQAHYKLGELYTEEYKYKEAYKSYLESTKGTCVSKPEPHYAVALALINLNRFEEAKMKLQDIIEKFPKSNFKALAQKRIRTLASEAKEESAQMIDTELKEINNKTNPLTESPKF